TNENTLQIINPTTGDTWTAGGNCTADILASGEYCLWEHFNIDGAVIQGLELTAGWEVTPTLTLRGNYTYTHSEQTSGTFEGEPLTRTPKHQATVRADWSATDQLDVWSAVGYYGEQTSAAARGGINYLP